MTKKLTEAGVKRARPPKTGQLFLWDSAVRGFGVRILPTGSKVFWFQYRPRGGGSSRMIRIGPYPARSVAKAAMPRAAILARWPTAATPPPSGTPSACAIRQRCACC